MHEPLCYTCVYGGLIFIDGKELYICYRYGKGDRIVEPQYSCPFYEQEEDNEDLDLLELEWEEPEWKEEADP